MEGNAEIHLAYCNVCQNNVQIMKRCTRCKKVFYCSRSCQIKDWPSHQNICTKKEVIEDHQKMIEVPNKGLQNMSIQETGNTTTTSTRDVKKPDTSTYEKCNDTLADEKRNKMATDVIKADSDGNRNEMATCARKTDSAENSEKSSLGTNAYNLTIKCLKKRHKLRIDSPLNGESLIELIASTVHIPKNKLKLICKGKIMTADNIGLFAKDKAIFQAIGEVAESEDDLESGHIDCIMTRLGVERNEAIKALRQTGDVVDAILYLGNR